MDDDTTDQHQSGFRSVGPGMNDSTENEDIVFHSEPRTIDVESFMAQIADLLLIPRETPDFMHVAINQISELVTSRRLRSSNDLYLQQTIDLKDQRIQELEFTLHTSQDLRKTLEREIEEQTQANTTLSQNIGELQETVQQFMTASGVLDSPARAIQAVRKNRRALGQRALSIDDRLAQIDHNRQTEIESLTEQIQQQGRSLHTALTSIGHTLDRDSDDEEGRRICETLESTNRLLAQRLEQLQQHTEDPPDPRAAIRRDWYRNDNLSPSIWMAKTREILSLERQIYQAHRELDSAEKSCEVLAQENLRLAGEKDRQRSETSATLL
jgi:hypothetical protein